MTADKRSVSTDALETLGTIIDDTQKRDAIHLAVVPVKAAHFLYAGQHVAIIDGQAVPVAVGNGLGVVDPFLGAEVKPGERFWLVIYPRKITSLRHVWTHPEVPDEAGAHFTTSATRDASELWLRDFCDDRGPDFRLLMHHYRGDPHPWPDEDADYSYIRKDGEYLHIGGNDAHGEIPAEFWIHLANVLGRDPEPGEKPTYFSCSC